MSTYDRAITVFSPDGHQFQVEYAMEPVRRGAVSQAIYNNDEIVIGIEKKMLAHQQDPSIIRKVVQIDTHITQTFAGQTADSRVLIDRARVKCQSHRYTYNEPCSVEQQARFVAETQQLFTQKGGRRPFGQATLITGFEADGTPRLFRTDPSGVYSEWKACSIGRSADPITRFLEKRYFNEYDTPEAANTNTTANGSNGAQRSKVASEEELQEAQNRIDPRLIAVQTLMEVVEQGSKSMEITSIRRDQPPVKLSASEIDELVERVSELQTELARQGHVIEPITLDSEVY